MPTVVGCPYYPLERYPLYKDSGVEWLGKIPAHWEVKRLKQLFHVVNGSTPKSAEPDYWDGDVVWITPEDLGRLTGTVVRGSNRSITWFGLRSCGTTLIPKGSLVLSTRAPIGHLAVAGVELCTNQGCHSLVFRNGLPQTYFFYYLLAARAELESLGQGSTFVELSNEKLGTLTLPQPTTAEQQAIAAFLHRETAQIDALVAKKERLIELLQEKRAALITRVVTKGPDPEVRMKDSGIEWLGTIPAHWDLVALRRRWSVVDCKHLTVPFVSEGIPLASVRETQSFELDLKDSHRTTFKWYETLVEGGRKPRCGDLIYCRNVSVGSASLVTKDDLFAMGQDVCLIRSSAENQRWLNYYLCSGAMSRQLASTLVGSTFDRINVAEIMALLIPVPPRVEQDKIAHFLDLETAKIDTLLAKIHTAIDRLIELRTALISAAVTGKIDVRDDADANPGAAS